MRNTLRENERTSKHNNNVIQEISWICSILANCIWIISWRLFNFILNMSWISYCHCASSGCTACYWMKIIQMKKKTLIYFYCSNIGRLRRRPLPYALQILSTIFRMSNLFLRMHHRSKIKIRNIAANRVDWH